MGSFIMIIMMSGMMMMTDTVSERVFVDFPKEALVILLQCNSVRCDNICWPDGQAKPWGRKIRI